MRAANKNIDWPLPCDLSEEELHEQVKKLLEAARHCFNDNPSPSFLVTRSGFCICCCQQALCRNDPYPKTVFSLLSRPRIDIRRSWISDLFVNTTWLRWTFWRPLGG